MVGWTIAICADSGPKWSFPARAAHVQHAHSGGQLALIVSLRNASCEGETVIVDTPDASAFGSSRK